MSAYDINRFEKYSNEAKERWGDTEAYREYEEKSKSCSEEKQNSLIDGMNAVLAEFAVCRKNGNSPASAEAKSLVKALQSYISENYYDCTKEILSYLGQMYVADERFRNNINKHGDGTAEYISEAVKSYLS